MSVSQRPPYRGEKIVLGDRALRVVLAGPRGAGPTIVLEHGAFGCAADWAVVQERLAAKGLRSVAYDRAGLGHSDPGPKPRDGRAIVADLAALLRELDEPAPYVLVGHSMGGLMVRLYALTHPDQTVGVVLVDAVTPDIMKTAAGPGTTPSARSAATSDRSATSAEPIVPSFTSEERTADLLILAEVTAFFASALVVTDPLASRSAAYDVPVPRAIARAKYGTMR